MGGRQSYVQKILSLVGYHYGVTYFEEFCYVDEEPAVRSIQDRAEQKRLSRNAREGKSNRIL